MEYWWGLIKTLIEISLQYLCFMIWLKVLFGRGERIFILVPNIFNYVILFVGFINLYSYSSAKGVNLFIMIGENLRQ